MKFLIPFKGTFPVTRTYDQHVARAKAHGWCYQPKASCPNGWYYGGIDYGMPVGVEIVAAQSGQVKVSQDDAGGYGHHIKIQHADGFLSVYGHLWKREVNAGDQVTAGQVIGYSGNTGNSTGPHLHFETRQGGAPFDPVPFLVKSVGELDGSTLPPPIVPSDVLPAGPVKVTIDRLRLRAEPGLAGFIAAELKVGAVIEITDATMDANGYRWRKLSGQTLYVAEISLSTGERYLEVYPHAD